jgi:hypothetical protein
VIERVVAGAVRARFRRVELSDAARTYLERLVGELEPGAPTDAPPQAQSDAAEMASLRAQTDAAIRTRVKALIHRIKSEARIDADEYHGVVAAPFALDHLIDLVERQSSSRTARELAAAEKHKLSVEQAVLDWASELPLSSAMVASAHGRLDYWRHA